MVNQIRLKATWIVLVLMVAVIVWFAPVALQSMALVAAKVTSGGILGYWIDRGMFPYSRPDEKTPFVPWMYRRAAVVSAGMVGMAVGV